MSVRRLVTAVLLMSALAACASAANRERKELELGARQFTKSCAGCHGRDARGNGPVAPFLKLDVPDLTLIAARRAGAYPKDEIYRIIDGQSRMYAVGERHMPIWGYEFFGTDADDQKAHQHAVDTIRQLVAYLETVQRAP